MGSSAAIRAVARRPRRIRVDLPVHGIARWGTALVAVVALLSVRAYSDQLAFGEFAVGTTLAPLYAMVAVAPAVLLTAAGLLAHWSARRAASGSCS